MSFPLALLFSLTPPWLPNPKALQSPQHTSTWQLRAPTTCVFCSPTLTFTLRPCFLTSGDPLAFLHLHCNHVSGEVSAFAYLHPGVVQPPAHTSLKLVCGTATWATNTLKSWPCDPLQKGVRLRGGHSSPLQAMEAGALVCKTTVKIGFKTPCHPL